MKNQGVITAVACAVVLVASACASGGGGGAVGLDPGRLTVFYSGGYVQVSQPSYVAIFELIEQGGVSIVFPQTQESADTTAPAGIIAVSRESRRAGGFLRAQQDLYRPRATGLLNRNLRRGTNEEAHFLAIASPVPLNVSLFLSEPGALREWLGPDFVRPIAATQRLLTYAARGAAKFESGRGALRAR